MAETIALLRNGRGMDFDRYVERVFKSAETAHKYQNAQSRNVTIRRLDGRFKVGDRVPFGTGATSEL
jgi:hypothetical protein